MREEQKVIIFKYAEHNKIYDVDARGSVDNLRVNGERIILPPMTNLPHWVEGGSRFTIVEGKR